MIQKKALVIFPLLILFCNACENLSKQNYKQLLLIEYFSNIQQIEYLDSEYDAIISKAPDSVVIMIQPIEKLITARHEYLDAIIDTLLEITDNPHLELNTPLPDQMDKFKELDNYEITTAFFIGDEPTMELNSKYSGSRLQKALIKDKEKIISELKSLKIYLLKTQIDTYDYMDGNQFNLPWRIHQFHGLPLAMVLGNLTRLQVQLLETKIQILELILNKNCYQQAV